ncbi:hypothetical protein [Novosphingobium sp. P6W]|uniref:hypothetical protein n=1 Tax=Novosphingobium sp. P6W TaxID=1609758 RepID=UPI0006985947|nr:hypothetical protein [Novosphingobium sp. P6W]
MAGRIARTFITDTRGAYLSEWTIDPVAADMDPICDESERWTFHPVENDFVENITRSFDLVR